VYSDFDVTKLAGNKNKIPQEGRPGALMRFEILLSNLQRR